MTELNDTFNVIAHSLGTSMGCSKMQLCKEWAVYKRIGVQWKEYNDLEAEEFHQQYGREMEKKNKRFNDPPNYCLQIKNDDDH